MNRNIQPKAPILVDVRQDRKFGSNHLINNLITERATQLGVGERAVIAAFAPCGDAIYTCLIVEITQRDGDLLHGRVLRGSKNAGVLGGEIIVFHTYNICGITVPSRPDEAHE